jgi:ABC-type multidrug transport system ATPase subunit
MKYIVPYVYMWQAGLAPEGRPAGVFLLLGPTGTGKTKTVQAIAELLHGWQIPTAGKRSGGNFGLEESARIRTARKGRRAFGKGGAS